MTRCLTLAILCAVAACRVGGERVDFERMREQRRVDPYEPSAVFADGKAMQAPPVGTVPREAAVDTTMPAVTGALLATGRQRFAIFCAACHGAAGFGGSLVAANMRDHRPPSLRTAHVQTMAADALLDVVTNGRGRMPGFAWALPLRERWAVVAYVGALQRARPLDTAAVHDSLLAASFGAGAR